MLCRSGFREQSRREVARLGASKQYCDEDNEEVTRILHAGD